MKIHRNNYQNYLKNLSLILIAIFCFISASKAQPEQFKNEIDAFIQWDKKNSFPDNAILFVGSSSIRMWNTAQSFPSLKVINRGFGGSQISDVNYYYEEIVKKYKPAKIVFYAGDNDIAAGKSADQVLNDFQEFILKVEQDLPDVKVYYLPIKPSISRWKLWPEMFAANSMIKKFIENKANLFYVETASVLFNQDTKPDPDLFKEDGLHLNEKGYKLWNEILLPLLEN